MSVDATTIRTSGGSGGSARGEVTLDDTALGDEVL